jgi:hypothetical protein
MYREDRIKASLVNNDPPVRPGQVWRLNGDYRKMTHCDLIRVVCRYPFSSPADGRLWVIEWVHAIQRLERMTERTLRLLYDLRNDVPEV